ncbi:MAG: glucose sorbosone dehydrogenase, partial [Chloroflexi bacterium]|nr:glucose sorbosone dehydrogenase [Chloroflexota bacterium]
MGAAVLGAQATPEAQKPPPLLAVNAFPNHSFDKPVDIAHAGDERLFVVEQSGVIRVVNGRGPAANINVFLDIKGRVTSGGEMGLLGLAFHPQYAQNGYFYVNYTTTVETGLTTH